MKKFNKFIKELRDVPEGDQMSDITNVSKENDSKLNEEFIRAKLDEIKDAYMSFENANFNYDLIMTNDENKLNIECGHYGENGDQSFRYEIDLNTLELKCYIDDDFDHEDEFGTVEEMFDHIEQEVGIYESKKHVKGFGEFINETFGLTGFSKVEKPQKFKDVIKVLKEVTDALERCAEDANLNVYDEYIKLGRETIKNAEKKIN